MLQPKLITLKINYKKLLESYQDADGENPFLAALNLLTFIKTIPFQIIKAALLGITLYVSMNTLCIYLSVGWVGMLFSFIGGLIGAVFVILTGALKFITDEFLDNVSALLIGIMSPIDEIYVSWKKNSNEDLSKKEFTKRFLTEAVLPNTLQLMPPFPFKKQVSKRFEKVMDNVVQSNEENWIEADSEEQKATVLQNSISGIEKSISFSKKGFNKPFRLAIRVVLTFWLVIVVLHYL